MVPGPGIARTQLPPGFTCSGINSGVRRYRPDLGIIISTEPAVVAGVYTKNECKAVPIRYCQRLLPAQNIKAIVTNSGQANAATGALGEENNLKMAEAVAKKLNCQTSQVLTASTGVIGIQLEIDKIVGGVEELVERQGHTAEPFALAILTTDLVPKTVSTEVELSGGRVHITGICKGSGMIHPNMGTMLGYFLTDAELSIPEAVHLLTEATDNSFNMVSVDGETSTNDCAFLMANGVSGVRLANLSDEKKFLKALEDVAQVLAKSIARDGEGATKLIEVQILNAPTLPMARQAARGLVMSSLVKTAIHGCDPNWGRILARLGADQVSKDCLSKMELRIQDILVYQKETPLSVDLSGLRNQLKSDTVLIQVDFNSGDFNATAWGCDMSKKYVEINAEYTT
ncbi:MAG: bifunctional glutamate N-acetyltransferase/amino-acid acetyltransferase ArgJ [Bdellovibrionales bacterium]|nr:bifunctional glutamate N-acetyltransferase/amino-acid acetyltransferase ArgJ [Bdellovibrionales bacterium]